MANPDLIKFILQAKERGFNDLKIKEALMSNRWPTNEINSAFKALRKERHFKDLENLFMA